MAKESTLTRREAMQGMAGAAVAVIVPASAFSKDPARPWPGIVLDKPSLAAPPCAKTGNPAPHRSPKTRARIQSCSFVMLNVAAFPQGVLPMFR